MNYKKLINPWIPEKEDDAIEGKLLRVDSEVGENKSMFYILETKESIRGVWGSTVLDEKMKIFEVGNYIKIVFLGKKKGTRAEEYKDFDVYRGEETKKIY